MRIARLNGIATHWREDGPPGAPRTLVLAHSLGTDLRMFDCLVARLPDLRILRYDLRGHGLSEAPSGDYFMGDLVADAAAFVEHAAGPGTIFAGISIGGVIAQGLAAERPDLLRGLVLMNTAGKIGTPDLWAERVGTVRARGVAPLADGVLERWFPPEWRAANADELAGWHAMLVRTPAEGYAGCAAALSETDLRESTARLALPTLVIAGSEDGSTPPDLVREMADDIDGARFHLIRGAGHLPPIDRPDDVAGAMRAFLDDLG